MHISAIPGLLLVNYLTCVKCFNYSKVGHPIYTTYSRLRQDILGRPVALHKIPPCLESGYQERYELQLANLFVNIHSFDEIKQIITIQFYFGMTWFHNELTWDPSDYDNISTIWVDSDNIWSPKIEINMGDKDSTNMEFSGDLPVNSDGSVVFMNLGFLSLACTIDFNHYPFDIQVCSFGFYPHGPPFAQPKFYSNNFSLSAIYNISGEWALLSFDNYIVNLIEKGNFNQKDNIVMVPTYRLVVRRNPLYYVVCIVFPLVLTSVMIPLVFVLPSQTGEKVSYLVALFTSTAVFLNYISDVMPRCLLKMPYLAMLLVEVLVEGLLAMLASLLVVNIHLQEKQENRKDRGLLTDNTVGAVTSDSETSKQVSVASKKNSLAHTTKTPMSKKLDRAFFLLFFIGQNIFLLMLFLGTDWIQGSKPGHE